MNKRIYSVIKYELANINLCEEYRAVIFQLSKKFSHGIYTDDKLKESFEKIHDQLNKSELESWRRIALLALVTTEEQKKEVRKLAFKRFFQGNVDIRWIFDNEVKDGGGIIFQDMEDVRNELKNAFMNSEESENVT